MGYLACVSIPRLRLQLFGILSPELRGHPMAVISEDKPLGVVLEANRAALQEGVRPGMRYASALSVVPALHAAAIQDDMVVETIVQVAGTLQRFSPSVEPARIGAGTFWLNATGLERLFGSTSVWAEEIRSALSGPETVPGGFVATVAVGWTRFGTYAAARMFRENTIFASPEDEEAVAHRAPLRILPIDPRIQETLYNLGIYTVRGFITLPEGGVRRRFGADTADVHRFVHGIGLLPVQSLRHGEPLARRRRFASPVVTRTAVRTACEELLADLHGEVTRRKFLVKEIELVLLLEPPWNAERPDPIITFLRPAVPTGDGLLLGKLLDLRIDNLSIPGPVEEIRLSAAGENGRHAQADLFARKPKRDPASADRAFAVIRAELGNDAVCVARILPEHLPLRRYVWEPLEHMSSSGSCNPAPSRMPLTRVRRIYTTPRPTGRPAQSESILFSGSWWDSPYETEYRYTGMPDGTVLWIAGNRDSIGDRSAIASCDSIVWVIQGSVD